MISLPVLAPGLPLPPFRRLVAAMLAAITCQRMIRPKYLAAAVKQADASARPASTLLFLRISPFILILEMSWRIFTKAHGSVLLPEGSSLEGDPFPLRGALSAIGHNFLNLPLEVKSEVKLWGLLEN